MRYVSLVLAFILAACTRYEVISGDPAIPPPAECFSRTPAAKRFRLPAAWVDAALAGRAVDETGRSVHGAQVRLLADSQLSALTNDSGYFAFAFVAPGKYQLDVRAVGYNSFHGEIDAPLKAGDGYAITLPVRYLDGPCSAVVVRRKPWWKWW